MRRRIRVTAPDAKYSLLSDGAIVPAFGVLGGRSGKPLASWVEDTAGHTVEFATPGKVGGHLVHENERVVLRSAGGGGYGDPLDRPAEKVAEDYRLGYISDAALGDLYGVVLTPGTASVDATATDALRQRLRDARIHLVSVAEENSYRPGNVSRHRICRLTPADAEAAGVAHGNLVELDSARAAPLRAWAVIDDGVAPGTCPIDPHGRQMLGLADGDRVELRLLGALKSP